MKIVYNTWFPFGNYHTLNFFGILFTKRKNSYLGRFTIISSGFIRIKMNFLSPTKIIRGEAGDGSVTDINVSDDGLSVDFQCEITSGESSSIAFFVDDGTSTPWFQMKITYA